MAGRHPGPGLPAPRGRSGPTPPPSPGILPPTPPPPSPAVQKEASRSPGCCTDRGAGCWEQGLGPVRLPPCAPVTLLGTLESPLHPRCIPTNRLRDLEQVAWLFRASFFCLRSQVGPAPPRAVGTAGARGPGSFCAMSSRLWPSFSHSQSKSVGEVVPKPPSHPKRGTRFYACSNCEWLRGGSEQPLPGEQVLGSLS